MGICGSLWDGVETDQEKDEPCETMDINHGSETALLAICEAYSLGFVFTERITKQDSRGNTADGQLDLGLDVKILVDM
ncbi:hypothetical protein TNCV_2208861 [Trichonephila clavipes]|nr:hypothetical protein TNCV_2208861 [Trichonephila clavipes]